MLGKMWLASASHLSCCLIQHAAVPLHSIYNVLLWDIVPEQDA